MNEDKIIKLLREAFPHGHPDFVPLQLSKMKLHSIKNKRYAHNGPPLGNFERVANIMNMYPNFPVCDPRGAAVMYMMKHFDALLWDFCKVGTMSNESLGDISVYIDIIRCMNLDG